MIMANPKSIKVFGESFDSISAVANHYEISESALAANTALPPQGPKHALVSFPSQVLEWLMPGCS